MTDLSKVLWAVQAQRLNFGHIQDVDKLTSFLDLQGTPYRPIEVSGINNKPVVVEWDGPVVFYGSTLMVKRVYEQRGQPAQARPGIFFEPGRFEFEAVFAGFGRHLLNADSRVMTLGELIAESVKAPNQKAEVFVRPAADLKEFTGGLMAHRELPMLLEGARKSRATPMTRIQVATSKDLVHEWRTIVIRDRVITGSQYRSHGEKIRQGNYGTLPDHVVAFAESCARLYQPAEVFVLDVGELASGELRIVECNCFNCSGWYWSDFHAIAREVSAYVVETWNQRLPGEKRVVHILLHGHALCGAGVPTTWPSADRWVPYASHAEATCDVCLVMKKAGR